METLAVRPLLDLRGRDMNVQVGGFGKGVGTELLSEKYVFAETSD